MAAISLTSLNAVFLGAPMDLGATIVSLRPTVLSTEICERIIDKIALHISLSNLTKGDLCACVLVSRAWVPQARTRYHIFKDIRLSTCIQARHLLRVLSGLPELGQWTAVLIVSPEEQFKEDPGDGKVDQESLYRWHTIGFMRSLEFCRNSSLVYVH